MNDAAAVIARGVSFSYGNDVAVAASTFAIPRASITALIGPNGSGKSTLLNGLAGLKTPDSGSFEFPDHADGVPEIAYVLQGTKVNETLPVTVREVVAMGRYSGRGAWRWLGSEDKLAIDTAMNRMGIIDLANKHLSKLSGGQRQRVFVAQGLAQDHSLLLLDEPLTGLDIISARAIDDVIHDEPSRGCTVVLTTHDLDEARVADYVILMSGGVVASGPPAEVLTIANLALAYGANLLHVDGDQLFIDDAHHHPTAARHTHERTIHVESSTTDTHGSHD